MYNSQYYTCEQIDQRLLQGYLDDYNYQNGTNLTKEQFLVLLFSTFSRNHVVDNLVTQIGYFVCETLGSTAAKTLAAANYELLTGGSLKVKFIYKNTANNATLNINGKGAKALYYQGERVSSTNTWEANEVVEIFYDGTDYYANNVKGGSGDGVYDVSVNILDNGSPSQYATLSAALAVVPANVRKPGMSIKFINSSNSRYEQYRYMLSTLTGFTTEANWQGVDSYPVKDSKNLIDSGAVYKVTDGRIQYIGEADLAFQDEAGNVLILINNHIKTKSFDSRDVLSNISSLFQAIQGLRNLIDSIEAGSIKINNSVYGEDLSIGDSNNNVLVSFERGHIFTKKFDSKSVVENILELYNLINQGVNIGSTYDGDLCFIDSNNYVLALFKDGHVVTKNFDSKSVVESINRFNDIIPTTVEDLISLNQKVNSLMPPIKKDQSLTKEFVTVLSDDFSSTSGIWSSSWSVNTQNKTFSPTGLNVKATTSKRFFCDKRCVSFDITIYDDIVLEVESENAQEASKYIFDIPQKTITQVAKVSGHTSKTFTFTDNLVSGRLYHISILVSNFNTYVDIIDTVTTVTVISAEFFGRSGYELKGNLSFNQTAGTLILLKNFSISIMKSPSIMFIGDSITAGAYFTKGDESEDMFVYHAYAKILGNIIGDCCSVSAGGVGMSTFEEMWNNEISFMTPKSISALVGTNGGFTESRIKALIRNFLSKTTIVAVHHLFGTATSSYNLAQYNQLLESILSEAEFSSIMSARFDITTSTQKSLNTEDNVTIDANLMYDRVIHPNYAGSKAMIARMKLDCPKLFRVN